tara:strand:+ start:5207 stop:7498 length:2292 start_codon:yes stop_codon:yes gene_type:complete
MADIKVVVDYSDLTGLIKTSGQTKQALSLMARSFAKTNDQKAYMAGIAKIVAANKRLGIESAMTKSQIMKLGSQMRQEALFAEELAMATAKASTHINAMGKSSNRAGIAMQQTGYQVGDFLVQVQGGTNPMVAFGQQATQLVGVLYLLPQATLAAKIGILGLKLSMGAIIAIVSIIVPLLSALGAYWLRSKENADEAKSAVDRLKSSLEALESITFDSKTTGLGAFEEKWKSILSLQREYLREQIKLSRSTLFGEMELGGKLNKRSASIERMQANIAAGRSGPGAGEGQEAFDLEVANVAKLKAIRLELNNLDLTNSETLATSYETALSRLTAEHNLTQVEQEKLRLFAEQSGIISVIVQEGQKVVKNSEEVAKAEEAAAKAEQDRIDKLKVINDQAKAELISMRAKTHLLEIENKSGKNSRAYKIEAAYYDDKALRSKLEAAGVEESTIESQLAQLAIQRSLTEQLDKQEIKRLAALTDQEYQNMLYAQAYALSRGQAPTTPPKPPSTKDSGKSDAQKLMEQVKAITAVGEKQKALVGLYGAEREVRSEIIDLQNKYGINLVKNHEAAVIAAVEMKVAAEDRQRAIDEALKAQKQLADVIGNSMSNAMMSIVDGTQSVKDAFKSMASDIIKHLYKVLVVQQMVRAFGGFLGGSSNTAIAGIGDALKTYEGGGYTGSGSRSGGLDGKGGFMAMVHPNETVVDHTKGQSAGGGVTIVQNINISTGVQQTVRAEIRQMMPQIANSAKAAVVDAKRRGGSYGKAFA